MQYDMSNLFKLLFACYCSFFRQSRNKKFIELTTSNFERLVFVHFNSIFFYFVNVQCYIIFCERFSCFVHKTALKNFYIIFLRNPIKKSIISEGL